jgi:hypothetical protein
MNKDNDDFFGNAPKNYEVPKSDSRFMSFKAVGTHKFRILERPIFGWEGWKTIDGKKVVLRFKMQDRPVDVSDFNDKKVTHFWAMPVWNYNNQRVEVLTIDKASIQETIETYARDEEWGSPLGYNISVTREGTTRENTKYTTIMTPPSLVKPEILLAWDETRNGGFDINELYRDGNPFKPGAPMVEEIVIVPEVEETAALPEDTAEPED